MKLMLIVVVLLGILLGGLIVLYSMPEQTAVFTPKQNNPLQTTQNQNNPLATFSSEADVVVDFSKTIGTQQMYFGANENDNWESFAYDDEPKTYHKDVGSKYIRVLIADPPWRLNTIPYNEDYGDLTMFINAILESGAIPFMTFAHEPRPAESTFGEPVPYNHDAFENYVALTVAHYVQACQQNKLSRPCDVNDWYVELWNEPFTDDWWPQTYPSMFNDIQPMLKAIAPGLKFGGPSLSYLDKKQKDRINHFIDQSSPDFISVHHYGNTKENTALGKELIDEVDVVYGSSLQELKEAIRKSGKRIQIINSEYNMDYKVESFSTLDDPLTATWYALALMKQIESVDLELFYSGTSFRSGSGFGMWAKNEQNTYELWPTYTMKKEFVLAHPTGSTLAYSNSKNPNLHVLANAQTKIITIVNTHTQPVSFTLDTGNLQKEVLIQPFEVLFAKV